MIQDILIPFLTIAIAELGDKTQLAVIGLATKTKKHLQLLLGIVLAFIIADGIAVAFGDFIIKVIPMGYIKSGAGIIFIIFGVAALISHKKKKGKYNLKAPFVSGFSLILLLEIGDKTQIAAGLFATRFSPILVLIGAVSALTALSIIAVYLGKFITRKINRETISIISGILFILIGIASFFI